MKTVFTDMLVSQLTVLDAKEDGKTRVRFKATQANVVNSNTRLYPYNVLNDGVERSNELVKQGRMIGESPHPKHYPGKSGIVFDTSINNSVIKIYNQFIDNEGVVYVDAEVLDTAKGKDLKALIDAGVPVGISMRALGDSVRKQIGGVMVDVATKLDINSYDVVMNPATPGCEIVQVLTDSQMEEVLADDVQLTVPNCPSCGSALTPQDPDNDNDLDFYSCESCKEVYIPEEDQSVTYRATQSLRKLPNDPDWDGFGLAREYKRNMVASAPAMDSKEKLKIEGEEELKIEDILAAMKDSEEFNSIVEARAKLIAQPALDAVQAQKDAADKAIALETAKAETKTFVDSKMEAVKGKVADEVVTMMLDSVKDVTDKGAAEIIIDSMLNLYSKTASQATLDGMGYNGQPAEGAVRVEVTHEHKPWSKHMKAMADAMDREAIQRGETIDPSIRKVNQEIVDKLIEHAEKKAVLFDGSGNPLKYGYEAMKDSAEFLDSVMQDSVSITTAQVLNQPTISALLLQQSFQDVESLQFLNTETFQGSEVRFMSEYYNSIATIDPATGVLDILVPEGNGIQESAVQTSYITFNPAWRRNAVSMTTDVINTLMSGPAKYDVLSRGIYHISAEKRRILDTLAYLEMVMSSDEYAAKAVTAETPNPATKVAAVSNGTNVVYKYNLTVGGANAATEGSNPVVRPRTKKQTQPGGQVTTVVTNKFTATVSASALTAGYLDGNGNIQGGTYAVDYENGIVYFTSGAGLNPSAATPVLPSFTYSAMTNYDRWSLTKGTGYTKDEEWINTLIQQISTTAANMGAAPRYKRPNTAIMSMATAAKIQNGTMWYKLNDPVIGRLSGLAASTNFGERSNVAFAQINAPWVGGDSRILLTQKGATKYAVETPYQIEGPFPKYDANGNIVDAKVFYGRENSVMCTPLNVDGSGAILNPVSRTVKIVS